jgi:hypothetical protein
MHASYTVISVDLSCDIFINSPFGLCMEKHTTRLCNLGKKKKKKN